MMRSRVYALLLTVIVLLAGFPPSIRPQGQSVPLIITMNGDLYSWQNAGTAPRKRTNHEFNNYVPRVSPDASRFIYKSTAQVAVDAIKRTGGIGGAGDLAANQWLTELASFRSVRIADQPANAVFAVENVPDYYVIRSDAEWSPDGQYLAWTEGVIDSRQNTPLYRLVVYSFATGGTQIIAPSLPEQQNYEGYAPIPVRWGQSGIAVMVTKIVNPTEHHVQFSVFAPDGRLIMTTAPIKDPVEFMFITDQGKEYLAVMTDNLDSPELSAVIWNLIDPATGEISLMDGLPEMYSVRVPEGMSLRLADLTSLKGWLLVSAQGVTTPLTLNGDPYKLQDQLTISPDGMFLAYIVNQGVYVTSGAAGQGPIAVTSGQNILGVTWGPVAWRIQRGGARG